MLNSNFEGHNIHRLLTANSPAAAAICSSTLSSSSQAAGWTSPYMSSVRMGAALISSDRGAGAKLITWTECFTYYKYSIYRTVGMFYQSVYGSKTITWLRMYFSMPVSFFPSVLESVGRLFMDGVLRHDLSEHCWHEDFNKSLRQG